MKNIISASRRTDIPAFYGDWFMNRIREGAAGFVNPFGGQRYNVSLRPEDVIFIVFWSKNFEPFLKHLDELDERGYKFYFQFTITGLPKVFEENTPMAAQAVETSRLLADRYSPDHVLWRFDPIIFTSITSPAETLERFVELAGAMEGVTRRCYFSYVQFYGKVRRNFEEIYSKRGITFRADPDEERKRTESKAFTYDLTRGEKIAFARELSVHAAGRGIDMHTCCGDYLLNGGGDGGPSIYKAHCVDGELIERLTGGVCGAPLKPTREECGCYESRDIGAYNTCPHGCHFCYANVNKEMAAKNFELLSARVAAFSMNYEIAREEFPDSATGRGAAQLDFES
ncbi:MAG: DUF1848 domain-containing protein [bacterium]